MTLPVQIKSKSKIDIAHQKIHDGPFLTSTINDSGLLITNPKKILLFAPPLRTPQANTMFIHFNYSVKSTLGVKNEFFENPTFSNNGIAITRFFNNREFGELTTGEWEDPTITTEGTKIYEDLIGSTIKGGIGGPKFRNEDEIILRLGTYYLIKVTPLINNVDITIKTFSYSVQSSPSLSSIF